MEPKKFPWSTETVLRERASYEDYEVACESAVRENESNLFESLAFDQSEFAIE